MSLTLGSPCLAAPQSANQLDAEQLLSEHDNHSLANQASGITTGTLTHVTGESPHHQPRSYFFLNKANQRVQQLNFSDSQNNQSGNPYQLAGQRVRVEHSRDSNTISDLLLATRLEAATAQNTDQQTKAAVSGSSKWITLMCKFSDYSAEPKSRQYLQEMYTEPNIGLNKYWDEVSYGKIDLSGSTAAGWFQLPQPRAYYLNSSSGQSTPQLYFSKIAEDCANAAQSSVDVLQFDGINLAFNAELDGLVWGGSAQLTVAGQSQYFRTTWLPPWGYEHLSLVQHEMGHGYGLPHSSKMLGETYDNAWDVMSNSYAGCHWITNSQSDYNCIGQHTIAYHKHTLGWFDPDQVYLATGGTQTLTLDRLSRLSGESPSSSNPMLAVISLQGDQHLYSLEVRDKVGFDSKLPEKALIIHEVDTNRLRPAQIVDSSGAADGSGERWQPGEQFSDTTNSVSIQVLNETSNGFQIQITAPEPTPARPSSISASEGQFNDYVYINWPESISANNYEVYQCESTAKTSCVLIGDTSELFFRDYTSQQGEYNFYRIKACVNTQCSELSPYALGYLNQSSLSTPGTVQASDGTYPDQIAIQWSAVPGATSYQLFRCPSVQLGACEQIQTSALTAAIDTDIELGVIYHYRVKACDTSECSGFSPSDEGSANFQPPATPTQLQASKGLYSDRVDISWQAVSGAIRYYFYICSDATSGSCGSPLSISTNAYSDTDIPVDTTRYYRARACNPYACSPSSEPDSGYRQTLSPAIPAKPDASDGQYADKIALSWSSISNASYYVISRCSSAALASCHSIGQSTTLSYIDRSLSDQNTYYYRIAACNSEGCSDFSDADSGYQALQAPTSPPTLASPLNAYNNAISVSWEAIPQATRYEVLRCTLFSLDTCRPLMETASLNITDTAISPNSYYFYRAKACNRLGCSAISELVFGRADSAAPPLTLAPPTKTPDPQPKAVNVQALGSILSLLLN